MNKTITIAALAAIILGAIGFYSGMKYSESKIPARRGNQLGMMNGAPGQFQNGAGGPAGMRGQRNGENAMNFIAGEIISRDAQSITVKLRDGGSKIIFLSKTTEISKTTDGAIADLEVGKQITATGTAGTDGNVTAQMIQIRPLPPVITPPTTK